MPCRSYEDDVRTVTVRDPEMIARLDKLTRENCMLRETLLKVPNKYVPSKVKEVIAVNQTEHRQEDIARLKKTFKASKDFDRFEKVVLADPSEPLEPQLGFDPDAF